MDIIKKINFILAIVILIFALIAIIIWPEEIYGYLIGAIALFRILMQFIINRINK